VPQISTNRIKSWKTAKLATHFMALALAVFSVTRSYAEQPPAPCHANPQAAQDEATVRGRGDVTNLPAPLQDRLGTAGQSAA
jgi:hypothetical protein